MKELVGTVRKRIKEFDIVVQGDFWSITLKDSPNLFNISKLRVDQISLNSTLLNLPPDVVEELTVLVKEEAATRQTRAEKEAVSLLKKWIKHGSKVLEGQCPRS